MKEQDAQHLLTWKRIWLILILIGTIWLTISARGALFPIVVSFILAYLLNPVVKIMEEKKIPRTAGILILLLTLGISIFLLWVALAPLVEKQIVTFSNRLPGYIEVLEGWLEAALIRLQVARPEATKKFLSENLAALGQLPLDAIRSGGSFLLKTGRGLFSLVIGMAFLALIPILTFYILRDFGEFTKGFYKNIPPRYRNEVHKRLNQLDEMLGSFIRGQLIVGLTLSVLYTLGLYLADAPFWLLLGILTGMASIFPYVEWIVGLPITLAFTAIQHQDWTHPISVLIVFAIISPAAGMFLVPRVIGGRVGLHPVVVISAILIGSELMGFVGILLAVPLAAAIKVGIELVREQYLG
ncbi:MAG: AI-2E family transporter [Nitrospinaceae bacterium]|jgi:predicted PurR-regulated permease PerM|nr:AI-2E family transporter [Nitrospinaceae bacterium]MBT3435931.1 AI-2E family transporter [Nitrospinaceae bacterium]MBT3822590.1 AI-2E family transporter [Nitrospinaceae bacterium]MBT4094242.1 AI-2E family transporter [Nitrospinaceae bacterium]MBT4432500.1 AI-2E family transporter [Nitrospinaceae bacterium]